MILGGLIFLGGWTVAHLPALLAVGSAVGVVATEVTAVEAGREYQEIVDKAKAEGFTEDEIDIPLKTKARIFAKPIISGVATVTCVFTGHHISSKRLARSVKRCAEISAAANVIQDRMRMKEYALEQKPDSNYRAEAKKAAEIADSVEAQDIFEKCRRSGIEPVDTGTGDTLWYEPVSKQFFLASPDHVSEAIRKFIKHYHDLEYVRFDYMLRLLGIPDGRGYACIGYDEELGREFYGYSTPGISVQSKLLNGGPEYLQLVYEVEPHLSER